MLSIHSHSTSCSHDLLISIHRGRTKILNVYIIWLIMPRVMTSPPSDSKQILVMTGRHPGRHGSVTCHHDIQVIYSISFIWCIVKYFILWQVSLVRFSLRSARNQQRYIPPRRNTPLYLLGGPRELVRRLTFYVFCFFFFWCILNISTPMVQLQYELILSQEFRVSSLGFSIVKCEACYKRMLPFLFGIYNDVPIITKFAWQP